jgi:hypothetical protein
VGIRAARRYAQQATWINVDRQHQSAAVHRADSNDLDPFHVVDWSGWTPDWAVARPAVLVFPLVAAQSPPSYLNETSNFTR